MSRVHVKSSNKEDPFMQRTQAQASSEHKVAIFYFLLKKRSLQNNEARSFAVAGWVAGHFVRGDAEGVGGLK